MENLIIIPYVKKIRILDECMFCFIKHCNVETDCNHSFCYDCFKKTDCEKCLICDKLISYLQPVSL